MTMRGMLPVALLVGACGLALGQKVDDGTEEKLIATLLSDASLQQKDDACARLKLIATDRCVPALTPLLLHAELSHSARYVLEAMTTPKAGAALLLALDKSDGPVRLGIINSLGVRREARAVPSLTRLIAEDTDGAASAAATALGHIGGAAALAALEKAGAKADGALRNAVDDGILACCRRLQDAGAREEAFAALRRLHRTGPADHVRTAAFGGMILASGASGVDLAVAAIRDGADPDRLAALQKVSQLQAPNATTAFAGLLRELPWECQIALLGGLAQRGDLSATPAVAALLKSDRETVRDAAVSALALIGSSDHVPALVELAATTSGTTQRATRRALLQEFHGDVNRTLVELVESAPPPIKSEAARTLARRGDDGAVPALLRLAGDKRAATQTAAAEALAPLAGPPHVPALVALLAGAKDAALREQMDRTLRSVFERAPANTHTALAAPILQVMKTGDTAVRLTLLPLCSRLVDPGIRAALHQALVSSNGAEVEAAKHALCGSRDVALLPDVLSLARANGSPDMRVRALRGAVRVATDQTNPLSDTQRFETLEAVLATSTGKQDRWLVLSGLAKLPSPRSLALVAPLIDNKDTGAEAAQAVISIAAHTATQVPEATRDALKKILASSPGDHLRRAANELLERLRATAAFVTAWQVSGPYRREGHNYAALFDTTFAPETRDAEVADWRRLPTGSDPARPWLIDILKPLGGGHQCVAYVRTGLHAKAEQPVRLEIGSDDGIKVWLNDRLIHANNTARPIQPGSDKMSAALRKGWNELMIKITQNNMGWEYCVRIVKPDGTPLDDLRVDPLIVTPRETPPF